MRLFKTILLVFAVMPLAFTVSSCSNDNYEPEITCTCPKEHLRFNDKTINVSLNENGIYSPDEVLNFSDINLVMQNSEESITSMQFYIDEVLVDERPYTPHMTKEIPLKGLKPGLHFVDIYSIVPGYMKSTCHIFGTLVYIHDVNSDYCPEMGIVMPDVTVNTADGGTEVLKGFTAMADHSDVIYVDKAYMTKLVEAYKNSPKTIKVKTLVNTKKNMTSTNLLCRGHGIGVDSYIFEMKNQFDVKPTVLMDVLQTEFIMQLVCEYENYDRQVNRICKIMLAE